MTITPAELELMMAETEQHRAGPVYRCDDGTLRIYYAGFNLTALAQYLSQELANYDKRGPADGTT